MKCAACGYEKDTHPLTKDPKNPDGPEFIRIQGVRLVRETERGYGVDHEVRISLHACPQCGTVRMEDHW